MLRMGISFLSSSNLSLKLSNLFMDNLRWMNIEHVVCYWIWMGIYINTRTSFEGQIICLILLIPLKKYTQCSYIWFQFHTRLYKSLRIFNELFQKSPPLSIEDSEFWILKIPGSRWKKSRKTPGGSVSFDGIPGRGRGTASENGYLQYDYFWKSPMWGAERMPNNKCSSKIFSTKIIVSKIWKMVKQKSIWNLNLNQIE